MSKQDAMLLLIISLFGAFIAYSQWKNKKEAEKRDAELAAKWAQDYHNPLSKNYDEARVAKEAAEQPVITF
jgi:hypothetical protein